MRRRLLRLLSGLTDDTQLILDGFSLEHKHAVSTSGQLVDKLTYVNYDDGYISLEHTDGAQLPCLDIADVAIDDFTLVELNTFNATCAPAGWRSTMAAGGNLVRLALMRRLRTRWDDSDFTASEMCCWG